MHLQVVLDMLPYPAASNHWLDRESAYAYLQTMIDLSKTQPSVYKKFCGGYHVFDEVIDTGQEYCSQILLSSMFL